MLPRPQMAVGPGCMILGTAVAATVVLRWALAPHSAFLGATVLDDSAYYSVIAQHVVRGQGFSFNGITQTNGFEPLWESIAVALAELFRNGVELLRALSLLSAVLWVAACWICYGALRKVVRDEVAGLIGLGMLTEWRLLHLAAAGMDFGVNACCLSILLRVLVSKQAELRQGKVRELTLLGLALAAVGLAHAEEFMLGIVVGGVLFATGVGTAAMRMRRLVVLAAPVVAVGMLYVGWNVLQFHTFLPISGEVKLFYQNERGRPNPLHTLAVSIRYVGALALFGVTKGFASDVTRWVHVPLRAVECAVVICGCAFLGLVFRGRVWLRSRPGVVGVATFVSAACVHFVVITQVLPTYSAYGAWYFPLEVISVWCILGLGVEGLCEAATRRAVVRRGVIGALSALVVLGGVFALSTPVAGSRPTAVFARAGQWLSARVSTGARVGAFSAGILAVSVPQAHVVNLDGLVNNAAYFESVKRGAVSGYVHAMGIKYISDVFALHSLRQGVVWRGSVVVPVSRLRVLRFWMEGAGRAYVIFGVKRHVGPQIARSGFPAMAYSSAVWNDPPMVVGRAALRAAWMRGEGMPLDAIQTGSGIGYVMGKAVTARQYGLGLPQDGVTRAVFRSRHGGEVVMAARPPEVSGTQVRLVRYWEVRRAISRVWRIETYVRRRTEGRVVVNREDGVDGVLPLRDIPVGTVVREEVSVHLPNRGNAYGPVTVAVEPGRRGVRPAGQGGAAAEGTRQVVVVGR